MTWGAAGRILIRASKTEHHEGKAERTIPMAKALRQRVLLPRLLVWAAMIHLHRGAAAKAANCSGL